MDRIPALCSQNEFCRMISSAAEGFRVADVNLGKLDSPQDDWWSVWRIDDTGNTFLVRERLTHAEAERLVAEFTARGHKQMYWSERESMQAEPNVAADGGA